MKWRIVAALVFATFLCRSPAAFAADELNTITVDPANLEFRLEDQEEQTVLVAITNQYDSKVSLQADLQGVEENTGRIIPNGPLPMQLADVITLQERTFTIPAHSRHFLKVVVKDSSQLPAGGQYAALVISDVSRVKGESAIRPQVSVGVFIVKKQGEVRSVVLTKKELTKKALQFPTSFNFQLANEGNVHVVPRGYIRVFDTSAVYFETVLNTQSQALMPAQVFSQQVTLSAQPAGIWPRRVTFEFGYRADGVDEAQKYTVQFWYVPWMFVPLITFVVGAAMFVTWILLRRRKLTAD